VGDKDVYFTIPNAFTENWIGEHFMNNFTSAIKKATGENYKVHFLVKEKRDKHKPKSREEQINIKKSSKTFLYDKYTFDSFVVGDNNITINLHTPQQGLFPMHLGVNIILFLSMEVLGLGKPISSRQLGIKSMNNSQTLLFYTPKQRSFLMK